jgi:hypothetical protein
MDGWLTPDPASESASVPTADDDLSLYQNALAATVRSLQSTGKQVILIQDTPSFAVDPLLVVRTARIPARRALALALNPTTLIDPGSAPPESSPAITASNVLLQKESQPLSAQLFDPKPALCPSPEQCAYRDRYTLLFMDSTHLSAAGATRALTAFPLPATPAAAPLKSPSPAP